MRALLVGNGFTSQLIKNYSNSYMMQKFSEKLGHVCQEANRLFEPLRKDVSNGHTYSARELLENQELVSYIKNVLTRILETNASSVFERFFCNYGLIAETQCLEVSSVESLLKIVLLFETRFEANTRKQILEVAKKLYYNEGNCGLAAVPPTARQPICDWVSSYDTIFTTNYDQVLDEACRGSKKVLHLHGDFYMSDRFHREKTVQPPEKAYTIWGIDGEDKMAQTAGGPLITKDGKRFLTADGQELHVQSEPGHYLFQLKTDKFTQLDIFGYSGENDQHINQSLAENPNLLQVCYYCAPDAVDNQAKVLELRQRFLLPDHMSLMLKSWDDVWAQILKDCNTSQ